MGLLILLSIALNIVVLIVIMIFILVIILVVKEEGPNLFYGEGLFIIGLFIVSLIFYKLTINNIIELFNYYG